MKHHLKLATRNSKLALWQAHFVKDQLLKKHPDLEITLVPIQSEGDEIQNKPLAEFGGKGLFIKRLEEALLVPHADFAVHSMKDVPPKLTKEFTLPAILARASPKDAFVSINFNSLDHLTPEAIVGTSSVRRVAQLKYYRKDLYAKNVRGNVDTRIKKLLTGEFDALILAQAGLERLGLSEYIKEAIASSIFLPSVGQGAVGVECLSKNHELIEILSSLNDPETEACVQAERSLTEHLGANCNSPVGSFAEIKDRQIHLQAEVLDLEGVKKIAGEITGPLEKAKQLGAELAQTLIAQGAKDLF